MHKKIITGALLVFFVTSMFSSQPAFAGGLCLFNSDCTNNGQNSDGNPCTNVVQCVAGVCAQPPNTNSCNDGNQCTNGDSCFLGSCVGAPRTGSCNDGAECTTGDICVGFACVGAPNTGNQCGDLTSTQCNGPDLCAVGFCVNPNFQAPGVSCDNGDSQTCTGACNGIGSCVTAPGTGENCNDSNQCTVGDICAAGLCVGAPTIGSCDDGLECTTGDVCLGIVCTGLPNTGNQCGDLTSTQCNGPDLCAAGLCVNPNFISGSCDDSNACTNGDVCTLGQCTPGLPTSGNTCGDGPNPNGCSG